MPKLNFKVTERYLLQACRKDLEAWWWYTDRILSYNHTPCRQLWPIP